MARRLVSMRRRVPPADRDAYAAAWAAARRAVEAAGAHAWAFVSTGVGAERIEFLEYAEGSDPRDREAVASALEALDRAWDATIDEWLEAG